MENKIDNPDLVKEQYKNSSNLDARINLHSFNINKIDWNVWCFDVVIARHMLYHVPNIDKALSEIKRVLKPNGKFYTSTNGSDHMKELKDLVNGYNKDTKYNPQKIFADKFGVENGTEILKRYFNNVKLEEFNGQIVVDKAEPIVGYVTSGMDNRKGKFDGFYDYVKAEIEKAGAIKINTRAGMFIASKF